MPWDQALTGPARPAIGLLLAAGVFVLLIACANLTSLMLVRLNARQREVAVRRALGAGGWQVARLFLAEGLLIAVVAGAGGLLLTRLALGGLPSLLPDQIVSFGFRPVMNVHVIAVCAGAALAAALLTSLLPLWHTRRADLNQGLREGVTSTGSARRQRTRAVLVAAEIALAVVLLVGAGLLARSFVRINNVDKGFNPDHVMTMRLTVAWERYSAKGATTRFFEELTDRLRALPGVETAAAASQFPPDERFTMQFQVVGQPRPTDTLPNTLVTVATPDLFAVLQQRMLYGRPLATSDTIDAPAAVVVNRAFMDRYLGGQPHGQLQLGKGTITADVVGVVENARNTSLLKPAQPEMYATIDQAGSGNNQFYLLLRTAGEPATIVPSVRRALAAMDPDQPLYLIQTMEDAMSSSLFQQRLALVLIGIFAVGALVVAAIGVYGVVSFWVATRAREIGIRVALGATRHQIASLVLRQTMLVLGVGAVTGLAGGILVGGLARPLLYGTTPADPLALGGVVVLLLTVGVVAAYLPSRRALGVDVVKVLRIE